MACSDCFGSFLLRFGLAEWENLPFFVEELCGAAQVYKPVRAPTQEIWDDHRRTKNWGDYEKRFMAVVVRAPDVCVTCRLDSQVHAKFDSA